MVFQMTPGTEAPAEMNTWFPQFKALWMAENTTNTMHNVLTLRGAQVRDPLKWATYIDETIDSGATTCRSSSRATIGRNGAMPASSTISASSATSTNTPTTNRCA